jgi:hypothetical protein
MTRMPVLPNYLFVRPFLTTTVMAGLVPAIHDFFAAAEQKGVDARTKSGHDDVERPISNPSCRSAA